MKWLVGVHGVNTLKEARQKLKKAIFYIAILCGPSRSNLLFRQNKTTKTKKKGIKLPPNTRSDKSSYFCTNSIINEKSNRTRVHVHDNSSE